jgi:prevent-host-death family protein
MSDQDKGRFAGVRKVDATKARQSFSDFVTEVGAHGRRLLVTRNGKPTCAMVSLADLDILLARDAQHDVMMRTASPAPEGERKIVVPRGGRSSDTIAVERAASATAPLEALAVGAAVTAIAARVMPKVVEAASRIATERRRDRSEDAFVDPEEEQAEIVKQVLAEVVAPGV